MRTVVEDITCGEKVSSFPRKRLNFYYSKPYNPLSKLVGGKKPNNCCKGWVKPSITYFEKEEEDKLQVPGAAEPHKWH